ncbi:MAG: ubiquinone anaerobic biosynthesis protein UbiU [Acidiferrobacteraceae bacterium]
MTRPELVCPAGSLPAVKAAVSHGADAVYVGFRGGSNARNFPGLNLDVQEMEHAVRICHAKGTRLFVALNSNPTPELWEQGVRHLRLAADLGADAVILSDLGLLDYAARELPDLRKHLSVQASATNHEAIAFYVHAFGISRAILPRVLSEAQVERIAGSAEAEIEVFGFGSLCVMVEGRCALSSYVTGDSPNAAGVCSPAAAVRWDETAQGRTARLNGMLIDIYRPGQHAGYPTICKGRFHATVHGSRASPGPAYYALEEPTCLNILDLLPRLARSGVAAIKVEGRQRSPAYVAEVTRVLRAAIDVCASDPETYRPQAKWIAALDALAEGHQHTLGALDRDWQ